MIIVFILYQFIQLLSLPIVVGYLFFRKFKGKAAVGNLKERLGFIKKSPQNKKIYWVHAVSVGEILSIQDFVNKIKKQIPDSFVYITVGTVQGKNIAQKNKIGDYISFLPFDFLLFICLAFKRIKPKTIMIIEADLWPNFLYLAHFKKIPAYLINARVSKKSLRLPLFYKKIIAPMLNTFKIIFTQNNVESEKFEKLEVKKEKLSVLGNIKILNVLEKQMANIEKVKNLEIEAPVLLVGSLHPGELDIYLGLFSKLKIEFENLKLIIAPRHFHWKSELVDKIKSVGCKYILWEKNETLDQMINALKANDVLLVCKLGELFNLYPICDIFFLGGTFVTVGGHNLLEPVVWKKVSIIGPHYYNCKQIADELEKERGLIKVKDEVELFGVARRILKENLGEKMGSNAKSWIIRESKNVEVVQNRFIDELGIINKD